MAKIDLEKKKTGGMGWLWALLLLLALVLLLWWFWGASDDEPDYAVDDEYEAVEEPVAPVPVPMEEEAIAGTGLPVAQILADPDAWFDRTVSGEAEVTDVPTDRGFWLEQDGERLFALIIDGPAEVPLHIQTGQTLDLTDATVYRADAALEEGGVPGTPLDEDTRRIAQDEEVVLVVDESDIEIL